MARAGLLILRRHPGKLLASVACLVMAGGIVGNAVFLQAGRHPAPLFGHASGDPTLSAVPVPVPRPVEALAPSAEPAAPAHRIEPAPPAVVSADSAMTPAAKASGPHQKDGIAQLLTGAEKPSAGPDARVATAQRSLAKLGFAVKPDGRMGSSTRQALETFERDHHLPASDAVSSKLLRELAAAAGHSAE